LEGPEEDGSLEDLFIERNDDGSLQLGGMDDELSIIGERAGRGCGFCESSDRVVVF